MTGRVLTGRAQRMGWGVQGGGRDIPGKKTKGTGLGKPVDTNSPDPCNSAAPVWFLGRVASVSPENSLEMQVLGPPRLTESEKSGGRGDTQVCVFIIQSLVDSDAY